MQRTSKSRQGLQKQQVIRDFRGARALAPVQKVQGSLRLRCRHRCGGDGE